MTKKASDTNITEKGTKSVRRGGSRPGIKPGRWADTPEEGIILLFCIIQIQDDEPETISKPSKKKTTGKGVKK